MFLLARIFDNPSAQKIIGLNLVIQFYIFFFVDFGSHMLLLNDPILGINQLILLMTTYNRLNVILQPLSGGSSGIMWGN
jgi:hypothetical protein